jgi:protein involved in polysaccharide export with SLBB domain
MTCRLRLPDFLSVIDRVVAMRIPQNLIWTSTAASLIILGCGTGPDAIPNKAAPAGVETTSTQMPAAEALCAASGPLATLRRQRMSPGGAAELQVGPGDELEVDAIDLPELHDVDVLVDSEGFIDLPLLGRVHVAGLTDSEVREEISEKAGAYQRAPRVHVVVRHFAARNVEVMGMVAQPGSYALESSNESLLSILGRAGGIKALGSEPAADMVVLFPANQRAGAGGWEQGACNEGAGAVNDAAGPACAAAARASRTGVAPGEVRSNPGAQVMPIVVDLDKPTMTSCLDTPARPGDVLMVPPAGQVGVYGWVSKPGSFDITSGMTVLGAITAAGGAIFSSNAEVMRTEHGDRVGIPVDLSQVEKGRQTDPAVQAGDVVLVKPSLTGAVPYALYALFNKFGAGLYLSPLAF